ncbi:MULTISPECIES: PH domain-containing protein [Bacillaceae]|uniref:PH domain-containing protein n=1 Tax=Evansella alkalicola TaxID=745819 RepID=A0ABS6JYL7_9BACI|nr:MULTISPECIES: PH domain-containing protein [Bacillaceae]MBU9723322.1 PH domain-containing protein [Bacillus alkalicola]
MISVKEPELRLAKDSVKVWMISETIGNIIWFAILGILFLLNHVFAWANWINWFLLSGLIVSVVFSIWAYISAYLKYKHWRYSVDDEFLQLKSGALVDEYQLIPMTKIQAVSTKQGPILRKYGLCSLSVQTMGSQHSIPALSKSVAQDLRNLIAHYANVEEED